MEVELSAEAKDKRINRLVALTVVVFSVATGFGNIKDGNLDERRSRELPSRSAMAGTGA